MICLEGHLLFIPRMDSDIVVTSLYIELGENSGVLQLVDQI